MSALRETKIVRIGQGMCQMTIPKELLSRLVRIPDPRIKVEAAEEEGRIIFPKEMENEISSKLIAVKLDDWLQPVKLGGKWELSVAVLEALEIQRRLRGTSGLLRWTLFGHQRHSGHSVILRSNSLIPYLSKGSEKSPCPLDPNMRNALIFRAISPII